MGTALIPYKGPEKEHPLAAVQRLFRQAAHEAKRRFRGVLEKRRIAEIFEGYTYPYFRQPRNITLLILMMVLHGLMNVCNYGVIIFGALGLAALVATNLSGILIYGAAFGGCLIAMGQFNALAVALGQWLAVDWFCETQIKAFDLLLIPQKLLVPGLVTKSDAGAEEEKKIQPGHILTQDIMDFINAFISLTVAFVVNGVTLIAFSILLYSLSHSVFAIVAVVGILRIALAIPITPIIKEVNNNVANAFATRRKNIDALWDNCIGILKNRAEEAAREEYIKDLLTWRGAAIRQLKITNGLAALNSFLDSFMQILPFFYAMKNYFPDGIAGFQTLQGTSNATGPTWYWFGNQITPFSNWLAAGQRGNALIVRAEQIRTEGIKPYYETNSPLGLSVIGLKITKSDDDERVSFDLDAGDWLLLSASSEEDKINLIDIITGFVRHKEGNVVISGVKDETGSIIALLSNHKCMMPSLRRELYWPKSGEMPSEDVEKFSNAKIKEALLAVGLEDRLLKAHPDIFPMGENEEINFDSEKFKDFAEIETEELRDIVKRLQFARAILHQSPILLIDDLTSGFPEDEAEKLCKLIKEKCPQSIVIKMLNNQNGKVAGLCNKRAEFTKDHKFIYSSNGQAAPRSSTMDVLRTIFGWKTEAKPK